MDASERDGRDDFESFFRGVFPKAVAVAQRVTGDRPSAEDAALEALARTHFRWKRIGGQMVSGLLMQLEDHNCWTIAEAAGHRGPHGLQHLLSHAVWDDQQVPDIASAWAAGHLDDGDAVAGAWAENG